MDKQRVFLWAGFVTLLFLVVTKTSFVSSLFAFLLLGVIPGTDLIIPFWIILILYPSLIVACLVWLRHQSFFIGEKMRPVPPVKQVSKKHKPVAHAKRRAQSAKRRARAAV